MPEREENLLKSICLQLENVHSIKSGKTLLGSLSSHCFSVVASADVSNDATVSVSSLNGF